MLLSNSDDYDDHWMLDLMVEDDEHLDRNWGGRFVLLLTFYWFVDRKIDLGDRKKTSVDSIWAHFLDTTKCKFNSNHLVAWKEQKKIFKNYHKKVKNCFSHYPTVSKFPFVSIMLLFIFECFSYIDQNFIFENDNN